MGSVKFAAQPEKINKGKSGGARVLYYYDKDDILILLIHLFKKSNQDDIKEKEKTHFKKTLSELLMRHKNEQIR